MNILFIEDEKELATSGIAQLELRGYTVFPAYSIVEAQAVLDDPKRRVDFLITDHRLPDGLGIQFVIDIKESFPHSKCAVVSGCLTGQDIAKLEEMEIPYFHKPLLYVNVIDELRRSHAKRAPKRAEPEPLVEDVPPTTQDVQPTEDVQPSKESPKRKGLTLWPFK